MSSFKKGYFRESLSPCVVPTLLTPKEDSKLAHVHGCHVIDKITVKYHFPIPHLDDMMACSNVFSELDRCNGYHQIHVWPSDERKKALKFKDVL